MPAISVESNWDIRLQEEGESPQAKSSRAEPSLEAKPGQRRVSTRPDLSDFLGGADGLIPIKLSLMLNYRLFREIY
ncbi:hypothetical protein EB061_10195 [bacterium]|nr:hypothetical protein [bacterium]